MDIREIHIDHFGVWEAVHIPSLDAGLNVIHLDDGGRPIDFSRFLHQTFFGYPESHHDISGSLVVREQDRTWRLERERDRHGGVSLTFQDQARPGVDAAVAFQNRFNARRALLAESLFVPTEESEAADRWDWLTQNTELVDQLLGKHNPKVEVNEALEAARESSLQAFGELLERLGKQRERLLEEIGDLQSRNLRQPQKKKTAVPKIDHAELKDELRMWDRQVAPLKRAVELCDQWSELQRLQERISDRKPIAALRDLWTEYQKLEQEKRYLQESVSARPRSKRKKPKRSSQRELRWLLEQRDWVTEIIDSQTNADFEASEVSRESDDELRHACHLLEVAQKEAASAHRRLNNYAKRTNIDWSTLLDEEPAKQFVEIANDSPIAHEAPEVQLAELKRRRLWIREEHWYLQEHQEVSTQTYVWLAILFTLSIASVFGTLLVVSSTTQWVLASFGLGGMVASGALKLSIELRASRQLNRTKDRLRQIDNEILTLTEQILGEQQDTASSRRRAEERLFALQIQQDAVEANQRLDGAEIAFRELLERCGLPLTLSPSDALRSLSRSTRVRSNERRSGPGGRDRKLDRWVKRARNVIARVDGTRPDDDPIGLITMLELLADEAANEVPASDVGDVIGVQDEMKRVRLELKRTEKRQRTLLRRAKVEDQFAFEDAVRSADRFEEERRRVQKLQLELSVAIESHDDAEDVREYLQVFDPDELRFRLSEKMQLRDELEAKMQQLRPDRQASTSETVEVSPAQRELDAVRLELATLETRIRQAMRSAQATAVLRNVATKLVSRQPNEQPEQEFEFLSQLTAGEWNSIGSRGSELVLENDASSIPLNGSGCEEIAWLALQLNAAKRLAQHGNALPVVVLADDLFTSPNAAVVFKTLRRAGADGIQILMLAGNRQLVNQLNEAGAPIVRVGLRERAAHGLRIARFNDEAEPEFPPRIAR